MHMQSVHQFARQLPSNFKDCTVEYVDPASFIFSPPSAPLPLPEEEEEEEEEEGGGKRVSWCVEPSQLLGIVSRLKTNFSPSLSHSAQKSFNVDHNNFFFFYGRVRNI